MLDPTNAPQRRFVAGHAIYGRNGCTTLSRSTIFSMVKRGLFPAPVPISANRVAWLLDEVQAWIDDRHKSHCATLAA